MHRLWNLPTVIAICTVSFTVEVIGVVRDDFWMTFIPAGVTGLLALAAIRRLRTHRKATR